MLVTPVVNKAVINWTSFDELSSQHKCTRPSGTCVVYLHKHIMTLQQWQYIMLLDKLVTATEDCLGNFFFCFLKNFLVVWYINAYDIRLVT